VIHGKFQNESHPRLEVKEHLFIQESMVAMGYIRLMVVVSDIPFY